MQDGDNVDYIEMDFGFVTNLNFNNPTHVDPDLLQILFSVEMLEDHPSVTNGSEFFVQAGVRFGLVDKDVLYAVEIPVYAIDQQYDMYTEPEKVCFEYSSINIIFKNKSIINTCVVTISDGLTTVIVVSQYPAFALRTFSVITSLILFFNLTASAVLVDKPSSRQHVLQ